MGTDRCRNFEEKKQIVPTTADCLCRTRTNISSFCFNLRFTYSIDVAHTICTKMYIIYCVSFTNNTPVSGGFFCLY